MHYIIRILALIATLTGGCATYQPETHDYRDPANVFNRTMFNFNYYVLDPYIAKPAAIMWRDAIPKPIRTGFVNVSSNIAEPASMVNYLLQGNVQKAAVHFTRFFLNTVFGLGGLIDVAERADPALQKFPERSFGNVLGHYGMGYGPYVVLPFYGPATLRDNGGQFVDFLYPPLSLLTTEIAIARWIFDGLETRAELLGMEDMLKNSDDPYEFIRQAYFQRHDFLAGDGVIDTECEQKRFDEISDYLDELDDE